MFNLKKKEFKSKLLEISISKFINEKRFTEYQIVIVAQHEKIKLDYFYINKRYSDFLNLHKILENEILYLPEFPKKAFFNKNQKILEERKNKFNIYLKYAIAFILRNNFEETESGKALFNFLNP